jgi:hypothetical protein
VQEGKQRLVHKCWQIVMDLLHELEKTPFRFECSGGDTLPLFPLVLTIVGDHPELQLLCGCRDQQGSTRPCRCCLIRRNTKTAAPESSEEESDESSEEGDHSRAPAAKASVRRTTIKSRATPQPKPLRPASLLKKRPASLVKKTKSKKRPRQSDTEEAEDPISQFYREADQATNPRLRKRTVAQRDRHFTQPDAQAKHQEYSEMGAITPDRHFCSGYPFLRECTAGGFFGVCAQDPLHQGGLGMAKNLIDNFKKAVTDPEQRGAKTGDCPRGEAMANSLNAISVRMARTPRFRRSDGPLEMRHFIDPLAASKLTAGDYRSMAFQLHLGMGEVPTCFAPEVHARILAVLSTYRKMTLMLALTRTYYREQLAALEDILALFMRRMDLAFGHRSVFGMNMATIKYHALSHFLFWIRELGVPASWDTQGMEKGHKVRVKSRAALTNNKTGKEGTMLRDDGRRNASANHVGAALKGSAQPRRPPNAAAGAGDGTDALVPQRGAAGWAALAAATISGAAADPLKRVLTQPEFDKLVGLLRLRWDDKQGLYGQARCGVAGTAIEFKRWLQAHVKVYSGFDRTLQEVGNTKVCTLKVRCSDRYHGQSRHDTVDISAEKNGEEGTYDAKVILILSTDREQLVFVRWFFGATRDTYFITNRFTNEKTARISEDANASWRIGADGVSQEELQIGDAYLHFASMDHPDCFGLKLIGDVYSRTHIAEDLQVNDALRRPRKTPLDDSKLRFFRLMTNELCLCDACDDDY